MTTEFQVPRISAEKVDDNRGTFTVEPLDKGFDREGPTIVVDLLGADSWYLEFSGHAFLG